MVDPKARFQFPSFLSFESARFRSDLCTEDESRRPLRLILRGIWGNPERSCLADMWPIWCDFSIFFPHPLRKEFCPLTVSQFLCPVSGQTSCQHRSQLLQVCLPTIIDFGASHGIVLLAQSRVGCRGTVFSFYTQQNSLVCSKVKFLKWRLGVPPVAAKCLVKRTTYDNLVAACCSLSQNKMLEELYGLASEPGVWRGNVDRCHSRQDFGSAGLLLGC
jgi:hypothetical protein